MLYWPKLIDYLVGIRMQQYIQQRLIRMLFLLLFTLSSVSVSRVYAQNITQGITDTHFEKTEDAIRMTGNVRFSLSESVQSILNKGIPVYFIFETNTSRTRWYWTDKLVYSRKRYIRLAYQPLTLRWRVVTSNEPFTRNSIGVTLGQSYNSLEAALTSVERISNWPVLNLADWSDKGNYSVQIRFRLDSSQLQQPLRLGAVGMSEWKLDIEHTTPLNLQTSDKTSGN